MKTLITIISFIIAALLPYMVGNYIPTTIPSHILMMWYCMCFTSGMGIASIAIHINKQLK